MECAAPKRWSKYITHRHGKAIVEHCIDFGDHLQIASFAVWTQTSFKQTDFKPSPCRGKLDFIWVVLYIVQKLYNHNKNAVLENQVIEKYSFSFYCFYENNQNGSTTCNVNSVSIL